MVFGPVQHFQGPQTLYSRARPLTVVGAKVAGATAMGLATAWQSTNQPTNQPINQSTNQSINQPINQPINHWLKTEKRKTNTKFRVRRKTY